MLKKENIYFLFFSLVSTSIGIFTTFLLSNYFSIEDFGKLQYLLTLVGVFTIFYLSGFDITIQKQIFKRNDYIVKYLLKNVMPFSLILLTIISIAIYFFLEKNRELIFYAAIITSIGIFDKTNAILNSKLKFKQLRYLNLYTKVFILIIVLIAIEINFSIETYIIVFTAASIAILIGRILYSQRYLEISNNIFDKHFIIKEGFLITLSSSYNILANWSEKVILGVLDINSLAIFTIGQLFPKVIKDNVKVILIPTLNFWASKGFEHYKSMIKKYQYIMWIAGILLYVAIYFMAEIIIINFFPKYEDSIMIIQLLSIPLIFKFIENMKMSSMALSKYTNVFNKINNISNTLKIVLVLVLIPLYGVLGAIASILIVETIRFILITIEFNKLY
ncbi:oligosaccharide flippase family protein [Hydrogenimonas thermophila]|uniref:oligosaccharide flippase family protein n=1 Tax=Hydrogenimonas thermophila TaxID=223786 RepID=UPI002936DCA3|nr:oligosaccharide flippase family protein [Hydrogenimonas thermophila]WOE70106.1 oligosaccharide flippase family protein [Hydrogenimonas thermophila]WOE72623.1 oligosaccharide flippase family protein [Hydrogenimonas thermophila]